MAQHDDIDSLAGILKDSISFTGQFAQVSANAHIRGRGDRGHDHRSKKNLGELLIDELTLLSLVIAVGTIVLVCFGLMSWRFRT